MIIFGSILNVENPEDDNAGQLVDPRAVKVWRWGAMISSLVVFVIAVVAAIIFLVYFSAMWPVAAVVMAAILILLIFIVLRYPDAHYRHLRYWVDDTGIRIREGIFWKTESSLPRIRIQHTDVSQGPLQRRHGVATLKLYTAGSQFTKIELDGLEYNLACTLRDQLQQKGADDAV